MTGPSRPVNWSLTSPFLLPSVRPRAVFHRAVRGIPAPRLCKVWTTGCVEVATVAQPCAFAVGKRRRVGDELPWLQTGDGDDKKRQAARRTCHGRRFDKSLASVVLPPPHALVQTAQCGGRSEETAVPG